MVLNSAAASWMSMRRVAGQSAPRGAGKAENAAEAADVGNHEATISSEHLMSGSPKDRRVRCGNGIAKTTIGRLLYPAMCLPCRRLLGNPVRVSVPLERISGNP